MPNFSPNFFSIVLLGRQNPQILNHDFLIKNQVLPTRKEPFKSLIKDSSEGKKPFSEYLSTPVVTTLTYKWISIIIEETRYQIKDSNFVVPSKSPIVPITKKYFGELLIYTPFILGGINYAGNISFSNEDDEKDFDKRLGIERTKFENYFKISKVQYSTKINFPWNEDKVELRIDKPKSIQGTGGLNFNFEFIYENIDSFIGKLDEADRVYQKFNEILKKLNVGKK